MKTTQTVTIMKQHGVATKTQAGNLLALDVVIDRDGNDVSEWVNVTGWSTAKVYRWLGY